MKLKILLLLFIIVGSLYSQTPEKMSYQAIIRDSNNELVKHLPIGMRISILEGSFSGTTVYSEMHIPVSNENGLVMIEIGTGQVLQGAFADIKWNTNTFYSKIEIDPNGGTNYTISGTNQLVSVPYAIHAKTAETITGEINEKDPIFKESIAFGITEADTAKWNTSVETTEEKDPVFKESVAHDITEDDIEKWNVKQDSIFVSTGGLQIKNDTISMKIGRGITWNAYGHLNSYNTLYSGKGIEIIDNDTIRAVNLLTAGPNLEIVNDTIRMKKKPFYLGQDTLGGIVYHLYEDQNGEQHGFIISKTFEHKKWSNSGAKTGAISTTDGKKNMDEMKDSPAKNWVQTYFDKNWYIPAIDELALIIPNAYYVNKTLEELGITILNDRIWSSTENIVAPFQNGNQALGVSMGSFLNGTTYSLITKTKSESYLQTRAIRKF